jgi:hypothetical protein
VSTIIDWSFQPVPHRRDFFRSPVVDRTVYANQGDGLQQPKGYAEIIGLRFAYATNGRGIVDGYTISAKRYALFTREGSNVRIIKASETVLRKLLRDATGFFALAVAPNHPFRRRRSYGDDQYNSDLSGH